jgi:ribose/xylose/arabinose/galactoside ABC-type transport system permease subunit
VTEAKTSAARTDAPALAGHRLALPHSTEATRALVPLLVAILALGIFGTVKSDEFLTLTNFQNIFQQIAVLGILAVGQTLLMVAGQLDLSVGSGAAFISIIGAKMLGVDAITGVASGSSEGVVVIVLIAVGTAIGIVTGLVIALTRVAPFIVTLGGLSVFAGLALILSDQQPIPIGVLFTGLTLGQWGPFPTPAVLFGGLCVGGAVLLRLTRLGRNAYAIGSNEEAAFLAGVPVTFTKIALYALNGALVGVAGLMLLARLGSGDPNGGVGFELQAITAVVLGGATLSGGRGTMLGTFLGVFLLGLISNALNIVGVPNSYERLVFGGVLIVAVVWVALGELRRRSNVPLHRQVLLALSTRRRG